jgi:branched-chain amino acid transport system ATP-binding protein
MDEICEGLVPIIIQELGKIIQEIKKPGVSMLLAEQNIKFAIATSTRCYVLEKGHIVHDGYSLEIPRDVILKYLGT